MSLRLNCTRACDNGPLLIHIHDPERPHVMGEVLLHREALAGFIRGMRFARGQDVAGPVIRPEDVALFEQGVEFSAWSKT